VLLYIVQLRTYNYEAMVEFYTKLFSYPPRQDGYSDCAFKEHHVKIVKSGIVYQNETKNLMISFLLNKGECELKRIRETGIDIIELPSENYQEHSLFQAVDPDENTVILITK